MKRFATEIYAAVQRGRLQEPFGADHLRRACPGWSDSTYGVFLAKHCVGDPGGHTELFARVAPGRCRTLAALRRARTAPR